jgi:hypothetical protein
MTLVRAAVLDERALAFMSVSASRLVTMSLVDCGLRLGLASTGVRVQYLNHRGGDLRRGGFGSLALVHGTAFIRILGRVRAPREGEEAWSSAGSVGYSLLFRSA